MWNDPAIVQLNPWLAGLLPNEQIITGYSVSTNSFSTQAVFQDALTSFSANFGELFAAANSNFSQLPPALRGTGFNAGSTSSARATWLLEHPNSLSYFNLVEVIGNLSIANMINNAGTLVEPTVETITSTMNDFLPAYEQGDFSIPIVNSNGTDSWPMAYLTYLTLNQNQTSVDCTNVLALLDWIAWAYTNSEYDITPSAHLYNG